MTFPIVAWPAAASPGAFVNVAVYPPVPTLPFESFYYELELIPQAFPWPVPVGTVRVEFPFFRSFSATIQIPNIPPQPCRLIACQGLIAPPEAETTFQILPSASMSFTPQFAAPSQNIAVTGSGYADGEEVDIWLLNELGAGVVVTGRLMADSSGAVNGTITVPGVSVGIYLTTGIGVVSGRSSRPSSFAVGMPLSCQPIWLGLPPTSSLPANVTGFEPGETIEIFLLSPSGAMTPIGSTTFTFPTSSITSLNDTGVPPGPYQMMAQGKSSKLTASAAFYVLSPPTVSPSSITPGFPVDVSVTGYPPNSPFEVFMGAASPQVSGKTDGSGNASVTVPAPSLSGAGPFEVDVKSQSVLVGQQWQASAPFTLLPLPPLVVSPPSGIPGTLLHLTGGPGFPQNVPFTVSMNGNTLASSKTSSLGSIDVTVPALVPPGAKYAVEAVGVTGEPNPWNKSAGFTSDPLPTPKLSVSSATPGTTVTVSASGYPATVSGLTLDYKVALDGTLVIPSGASDSTGSINGAFTVPNNPGTYTVYFSFTLSAGSSSVSWKITGPSFTVESLTATLAGTFEFLTLSGDTSSSATVVVQGTLTTSSGSGSGATSFRTSVDVYIPATGGCIPASFNVPGLQAGMWTITALAEGIGGFTCPNMAVPGGIQMSLCDTSAPEGTCTQVYY